MKRLSYLAAITALSSLSLTLAGCGSDNNNNNEDEVTSPSKKNVILMITDGASDGAWDIASFWTDGALLNDTFPYSELDTRYGMATYALNGNSAPDTSDSCSATEEGLAGQTPQENIFVVPVPFIFCFYFLFFQG